MSRIGALHKSPQILSLLQQALELHQGGQIEAAEALYRRALATVPDHPDALHLMGLTALQRGDTLRAIDLIRKAATLQPRSPIYHGNLANALFQLGRHAEAIAEYREAAKLKHDEPQYPMGIANCQACLGDHATAETQLREVARRFPRYALAWFNLGNTVRDQGRAEEAADLYRQAIQLDRGLVDAHVNRGNALRALNRPEDAKRAFSDALELRPDYASARFNLASVLVDLGRFAEAEEMCRKLTSDEPGFAQAHLYLGAALRHQGRLTEALPNYRKALELDPGNAIIAEACALVLGELGDNREAFRCFLRALALNGGSAATHRNLGALLLAKGQLADGWRHYSLRPEAERLGRLAELKLSLDLPAALAGKHICVLREQGLGDEIFFLRYVRELHLRGARISYRGSKEIRSLLQRANFVHELLEEHAPVPDADAGINLGDLPHALTTYPCSPLPVGSIAAKTPPLPEFGQRIGIFFPPVPPSIRLVPDAARVRELVERLSAFGSPPYTGVTWRAGTLPAEQSGRAWMLFKEIGLEHLARAIAPISGTLISIQRIPKEGEISALSRHAGRTVHDLSALNGNLEEMLALLALLDEYVGVSNTNMHLRTATGKTARVLAPRPAEWRWMAHGDESPWFPGFRIYRQTPDGSWDAAIERLRADLLATIGGVK
jgi:tetratricopeptide (TPR) repeat protein